MALEKEFGKDKPLLTTVVVASMLQITPDRLRTYDTEKLIKTFRKTTGQVQKRLYSQYDVEWLQCLRILMQNHKMNINSIKIILQIIQKNQIKEYPKNEIGRTLQEMAKNPNFNAIVKNF